MERGKSETTVFSIVTYEAPEYFIRCIRNLEWVKGKDHIKVVVFDNSNSEKIKKICDNQKELHYYKSDENVGYGKSHNRVWKFAQKEYSAERILILNPDLILDEDSFDILEEKLEENSECAIVAPKINDENGEIEPSIFTDPSGFGYFGNFISQFLGRKDNNRYGLETESEETYVKGVTGACLLVRGAAITEENLFDPDFFMYFEDLDLCSRLRNSGWKILYTPEASITHFQGKSSEDFENREEWLKEMMYRSLKMYFDKNKDFVNRSMLNLSLYTALQLRIILNKDKEWAIKIKEELY